MSFLNNLIENAFTKMIKNVCFKDSPWNGTVRVTSFRALKEGWTGLTLSDGYLKSDSLNSFRDKLGEVDKLDSDYNTIIVIHANKQNDYTKL